MRFYNSILAALAVAALVPGPAAADEASDRTAIEAAAQAWTNAYNARDLDALLGVVAEDVVLIDPVLAPVSGREAVRAALDRTMTSTKARLSSTTREIVVEGDIAWRIGVIRRQQPNAVLATGQSLEIWQRAGERWQLRRQMSAGILAPIMIARPRPNEPRLDTP